MSHQQRSIRDDLRGALEHLSKAGVEK